MDHCYFQSISQRPLSFWLAIRVETLVRERKEPHQELVRAGYFFYTSSETIIELGCKRTIEPE